MNNLGTVALAFMGGIFLVVITLATGLSLWVAWDARRRTMAVLAILEEHQKTRQQDMEEMRRVLENGRNVFQGIRSEMKSILDAQLNEMRASFKAFELGFRAAIRNINGKSLAEASGKMVKAVQRLEGIYNALSSVVEASVVAPATPEEWQNPARADESAPINESSVQQSIYARQDVPAGTDTESENEFERLTENLFT
jgi:hypothetical protein